MTLLRIWGDMLTWGCDLNQIIQTCLKGISCKAVTLYILYILNHNIGHNCWRKISSKNLIHTKDIALGSNVNRRVFLELIGTGASLNTKENQLKWKTNLKEKVKCFILCDIVKLRKISIPNPSNKLILWFNLIQNQISNSLKPGRNFIRFPSHSMTEVILIIYYFHI